MLVVVKKAKKAGCNRNLADLTGVYNYSLLFLNDDECMVEDLPLFAVIRLEMCLICPKGTLADMKHGLEVFIYM